MTDKIRKTLLKFLCFGALYLLTGTDLLSKILTLPDTALWMFGIHSTLININYEFVRFVQGVFALLTLIYGIVSLLRLYDFKFLEKNHKIGDQL